jgi:predicted sugar kinase
MDGDMTTEIELASPACLTLAAARLQNQPVLLGITLQHPPVHLFARPAAQLAASGARADLAYQHGQQFMSSHNLAKAAHFEIELAIAANMGLGSGPMLGLSVARSLAILNDLPADNATALAIAAGINANDGLEVQAFGGGGLLLVNQTGTALRRKVIAHLKQAQDWVFVMVLPRPPAGTPDDLEAQQRRQLWQFAAELDESAEKLLTERLWPATENDDIAAFGTALMELQGMLPTEPPNEEEDAIFAIMREAGSVAWGRARNGMGLYGLIRGADPSRKLRRSLADHLGYDSGMIMATICETKGVRNRMK